MAELTPTDSFPASSGGWQRRVMIGLLAVAAVVLAGWALRATYVVSMPLAFAFFITVLVRPIERGLRRRLPPRLGWLGVAAAMATLLAAAALFAGVVWLSIELVAEKAPQYAQQLQAYWQQGVEWAHRHNLPIQENPLQGDGGRDRLVAWLQTGVMSIWSAAAFLVLVFFFVLLMLLEVDTWREKARQAFRGGRQQAVIDIFDTLGNKLRHYMWVHTVISVVSGIVAGLWLWLMGVDFALVWGLLTILLNYVPNIGSIIAALLPALLALVQFGWGWGLLVLGGLTVIDQVIGNFIGPRMEGKSLRVSPLVLLAAVIFWGWLWGVPGMLLAVPMAVAGMIVCAHLPSLRPLALMLSTSGDYQRLDENTHDGGGRPQH